MESGKQREQSGTYPSHPLASMHDHAFTSPTYEAVIKQHIDTYIQSGGKKI